MSGSAQVSSTGVRPASTPIQYEVDLSQANGHLVKVNMTVEGIGRLTKGHPDSFEVALPIWTPGAYDPSWHPSKLDHFEVSDEKGNPLPYEKVSPDSWKIQNGDKNSVRISYALKADQFDFIFNDLNANHGYLNGAATFMYVKGHESDVPATVRITGLPNPKWNTVSQLAPVKDSPNTYYASSFDDLADSNIEASDFKQVKWFVNGTEVTLAVHGTSPFSETLNKPSVSLEEAKNDWTKIIKAKEAMFGPPPEFRYLDTPLPMMEMETPGSRYVVIKHYTRENSQASGLEHLHGTDLIFKKEHEPIIAKKFDGDVEKLENHVSAHELMHQINVKLVKPAGISPYSYGKENPIPELWWAEGVTDYFSFLVLARAGLMSPKEFTKMLSDSVASYQDAFKVHPSNAADDSTDAWMALFSKHLFGLRNYYNKGLLLGMALDLEIRSKTRNERSLEDVMNIMTAEFGGQKKGYTNDDIQRIAEKVAGCSFEQFFQDYLRDRKPIDFNRYLSLAGLELEEKKSDQTPMEVPFLGMTVKAAPKEGAAGQNLVVADLKDEGVAMMAGLEPKEVIQEVTVKVKRTDPYTGKEQIVEVPMTPAIPEKPPAVVEKKTQTQEQKALLDHWLRKLPEIDARQSEASPAA